MRTRGHRKPVGIVCKEDRELPQAHVKVTQLRSDRPCPDRVRSPGGHHPV